MISDLTKALSDARLVQSFSGVRTVFGQGPEIREELRVLAAAYGYCCVRRISSAGTQVLLLGRDPRPTGEAIVQAIARGFLAGAAQSSVRLRLVDLGIITTPLAETAVRALEADGGVMVTASHNPIDYNGFKFLTGCSSTTRGSAPAGALLSAQVMADVIDSVRKLTGSGDNGFVKRLGAVNDQVLGQALTSSGNELSRVKAERAYLDVIGEDWGIAPHCLKPLTLGPALLDPNGGAGCGIDARVLEHFGVRVIEINAELGYPEHGIDTDGVDPASGRHMLLRVSRAAAREGAHFGVAFDYDADRGNLVLPGHDESAIIPPQRVATFNIALGLARRKLKDNNGKPLAIVASDATSLASHRVARAFGAEVFQVETGEINVVTKMHTLRQAGYDVPVGVEGANGGTIFESATCRDGLQVALSAAQAESMPEVACEWMRLITGINGRGFDSSRGLSLRELLDSIPMNSNVMFKLSSPPMPHGEVKRNMERYFVKTIWPSLNSSFETYQFQNFEETEMVEERTGDESGAWRIMLSSPEREAFVFVRGSRTESGVWRMIVDADQMDDYNVVESAAREMFEAATQQG